MKIISKYPAEVIPKAIVKYRKLTNSLTSKTMSRWWVETKETLDDIFADLSNKYENEKKYSYAKVGYYKAQYLISIDKLSEARQSLAPYKNLNGKYKVLYFASFSKFLWKLVHKFK
jgi:hypothetical protein